MTVLLAVGLTMASCASWGHRETGAVVGTATGGTVGGVIGNQTGSTARGAIIERVGEGIHITFPSGLLFDFDSHAIRADAAQHLKSLVTSLGE